MKIFYISFLIFLMPINMFAQWEWQNPKPTYSDLSGIDFIIQEIGYAIGENGTILKTVNGGIDWKVIECRTNDYFYSLDFINEQEGWVGGQDGILWYTSNGGKTWNVTNYAQYGSIKKIFFHNSQYGWVLFSDGFLIKTVDGGDSWTTINITSIATRFENIIFLNSNIGWLSVDENVGYNIYHRILKSIDGGFNWIIQWSSSNKHPNSLYFVNEDSGWAAGHNATIINTTNGGENWNLQLSGGMGINSIRFINSSIGFAASDYGRMYYTTNGGNQWTYSNIGTIEDLQALVFVGNMGYVVGNRGTLYKTENLGNTWIKMNSSFTDIWLYDVYATNKQNLLAVGSEGIILHSTNGGENWLFINSGVSTSLHSIFFINKEIGWIVGGNETILKTTDKGMTWEFQHNIPNSGWLLSVFFHDNNTGWAVGTHDRIYKTTNGGLDWIRHSAGNSNYDYYSLHFVDDTVGWIAGQDRYSTDGVVQKTTNGGITWELKDSTVDNFYWKIYFKNLTIGWLVGLHHYLGVGYGKIYGTTNGAETWNLKYSGGKYTGLHSLNFVDDTLAIASGSYGTIIKTTNGGNSWIPDYSHTRNTLESVVSLNKDDWIVVGKHGTILKYHNDFITFSEEVIDWKIVDNYKLSQNYPNPFNPTTSIQYTISSMQFVTIKIYDLLGREIATLINEEKPAGEYQVEFKAVNLPSGIYFYRIKAGSYINTKKMVLLR